MCVRARLSSSFGRAAERGPTACVLQPIDHDVVTRPAARQRDKGAAAATLGGKLSYMCARHFGAGRQHSWWQY